MDIKKPKFWILGIALIGASLYLQTINYGYSADDGIYSYFNRVTKTGLENWTELFQYGSMNFIEISPSNTSIYRPFTLLTFAIENALVGEFKGGVGHGVNVVLYFFLLWVLGLLLLELFRKRKIPDWVAILILMLYAVHPIHTEVVASVKSRDTLLSALFAFSAILIWVKSYPKISIPKWLGILVLFFFSLISKEESVPLLALVGCVSWFFFRENLTKSLGSVLPFLIPVGVYLGLRAMILDPVDLSYTSTVNSIMYGAQGGDYLATNLYIYLQYLKLLFFPHPLSWDYSFNQLSIQSFASLWVWFSIILFGALIYVAVKGFKERNLFSFGIIFYLTSFSIFANLTTSLIIGSNLGERFLFIPSLAFSILIVLVLHSLGEKYWSQKSPWIAFLILIPFLIGFSWKTYARSQVWESNLTLSASGVETSPKSWRTHMMYAEELRLNGNKLKVENPDSAQVFFQLAETHFAKSFEILGAKNSVPQYLSPFAEVLLALGDSTQAESIFLRSIEKAPKIHYAWFKLGMIHFQRGEFEQSRDMYLKALEADKPDYYATYKNLAQAYFRLDQNQEAIVAFEKSKSYKEDPETDKLLAYLYSQMGMLDKVSTLNVQDSTFSVEETQFLVQLRRGNDAYSNKRFAEAIKFFSEVEVEYEQYDGRSRFPNYYAAFGKALIEMRDTTEAKKKFTLAYSIIPDNHVVLTNLGIISLLKDKRYSQAEQYFRAAVNANPEDPFSARTNLGTALIMQRKEQEAIQVFEDALNYGSSRAVISNLYLLNKAIGNEERMNYYLNQLNQ